MTHQDKNTGSKTHKWLIRTLDAFVYSILLGEVILFGIGCWLLDVGGFALYTV